MHDHEINGMVQGLIRAGLVDKDRETEAAGVLGSYWRHRVALVYTVDDIMHANPGMSRDYAAKQLKRKQEGHERSRERLADEIGKGGS